jgi:hypothetical protein
MSDRRVSESSEIEAALDEELASEPLLEGVSEGELALLLRNAASPSELDSSVHEALLARAMGTSALVVGAGPNEVDELDPPAGEAEALDAERLGRALDGEGELERSPLVALALALRAASRPRPLDDLRHEAMLRARLRASTSSSLGGTPRAWLAALALAAAAGGLYVGREGLDRDRGAVLHATSDELVIARSTAGLFRGDDFPREGGERARVDRIASARRGDLRRNRYRAWGVR